jgi:eukaryotic-like serine/threonine-protein kinase
MQRDDLSFEDLGPGILFAGRYALVLQLGQGGFAKVFLASDQILEVPCAVKVLSPTVAHDEAHVRRFRREVTLARRITHRNVCKLYDVGQAGALTFLTMEHIDGQSLHEILSQRRPLELRLGLEISLQIAHGLGAAHAEGVVHRDLKPHNVLLDHGGTLKLLDFGIARSMDADGITATGVMMGTPTYMSPEQCRGERGDQRSDLYSLGVVMYQIFTGWPPFRADTPLGLLFLHTGQAPQPPAEVNRDLPPEVDELILRCLAKDPAARFGSAGELASAIEGFLAALGDGAFERPSALLDPRPPEAGTAAPSRQPAPAGAVPSGSSKGAATSATLALSPGAAALPEPTAPTLPGDSATPSTGRTPDVPLCTPSAEGAIPALAAAEGSPPTDVAEAPPPTEPAEALPPTEPAEAPPPKDVAEVSPSTDVAEALPPTEAAEAPPPAAEASDQDDPLRRPGEGPTRQRPALRYGAAAAIAAGLVLVGALAVPDFLPSSVSPPHARLEAASSREASSSRGPLPAENALPSFTKPPEIAESLEGLAMPLSQADIRPTKIPTEAAADPPMPEVLPASGPMPIAPLAPPEAPTAYPTADPVLLEPQEPAAAEPPLAPTAPPPTATETPPTATETPPTATETPPPTATTPPPAPAASSARPPRLTVTPRATPTAEPPPLGRIVLPGAPLDAEMCVDGQPGTPVRGARGLQLEAVEVGSRRVLLRSPTKGWVARTVELPATDGAEATLRLLGPDWRPPLYRVELAAPAAADVEIVERAEQEREVELTSGERVRLEFDPVSLQLLVHRADGRQEAKRCVSERLAECAVPLPINCGRMVLAP